MHDPDAELMRRAGAGDAGAVNEIVRRHAERIVRVSRRVLGDAAEAEDVAQEVFLRVWKHAANWRTNEAKLATWMHRVMLNLCTDRLRRRREVSDPEAGVALPDPGVNAEEGLQARERSARVHAALALLPERQRAAIALCYFEEISNIEAAEALEVSVEALESLLSRARRSLRERLSDEAGSL